MDIIYFYSSIHDQINIDNIQYDHTYSYFLFNDEKTILTGFLSINLSDLQTKKIKILTDHLNSLYHDIIYQVDLENKELHYMHKFFYDFFIEYKIDEILVNEKVIDNDIILKFMNDYIFNKLNLTIKHSSFNIVDNIIIESVYICEKNESSDILISNYFTDTWKTKIKKFYNFSLYLKNKGFNFNNGIFIKHK